MRNYRALLIIILITGTKCTAQQPSKPEAQRGQTDVLGNYIQAAQHRDYKTLIDLTYVYQADVAGIKAQNPQVLWPKLIGEYYDNKIKNLFQDPGSWGNFLQGAMAGMGDQTQSIRALPELVPVSSKWSVSESRQQRGVPRGYLREFNLTVAYVSVAYSGWNEAPLLDNKILKEAILEFVIDRDSQTVLGAGRMPAGDVFWEEPLKVLNMVYGVAGGLHLVFNAAGGKPPFTCSINGAPNQDCYRPNSNLFWVNFGSSAIRNVVAVQLNDSNGRSDVVSLSLPDFPQGGLAPLWTYCWVRDPWFDRGVARPPDATFCKQPILRLTDKGATPVSQSHEPAAGPPASPADSGPCSTPADLGYSLLAAGHLYRVRAFSSSDGTKVHIFYDEKSDLVTEPDLLEKLATGAWTRENIVVPPDARNGSRRVSGILDTSEAVQHYEMIQSVLAMAMAEALEAAVTGGTSLEKAVPGIGWNFVRSQFGSPATARTVITLAARAGLQKSLSGYKQLDVILPPADASALDLTTLLTVKRLYTTAQGLELPEGALASALMPKNAADLTNQYLQSLLRELVSGFPSATDAVTLKNLLDLQKSFATLGQASTALRTYYDNLNLAINLAQENDSRIEAWAKQANSTSCVATKSASNQAALPASQPSVPASAQMTFSVRHRHSTFFNLQTSETQSFCSGTLSVFPDGTVKYDCEQTQDPSGRCEHVSFSPGSLKQLKIGLDGSLHLASKTQGNFDLSGDRNIIKQAQAAISPLIQK